MSRKIFALLAAALFSSAANAYEIRFEDGYTTDWQNIAADFGSVAGLLDVSYWDPVRNTNALRYWSGAYSGHPAAFASTSDAVGSGFITLTPAANYQVKLNSFFLGAYPNTSRSSSYTVDNLATAGIDIASGSLAISGATGLNVQPALFSAQGITIGFGPSAYNVGINYINFDVTPVPEPETYALLLAGLGLIGWRRMRGDRA